MVYRDLTQLAPAVLIVDDNRMLSAQLARLLRHVGATSTLAHSLAEARTRIGESLPDVVLLDLHLPDGDGVDLLVELKPAYPDTQFIVITAHGSIDSVLGCIRAGAVDYLTKPFEPDEMYLSIKRALSDKARADEVEEHRSRGGKKSSPDSLDYPSTAMRRVRRLGLRVAENDGIVVLFGESGTGKDFLARWIHDHSSRRSGPFFSINCSALPQELAESELFGHEPGAFTGSRRRKRGLLELAREGSLLLNEIGELPLPLQAKLLTFLDTRTFMRVGGERAITVNSRLLFATNRDLLEEVAQKRFRADLYYRLNVFPIVMPPLRERTEDIPMIVEQLCSRLSDEMPGSAVTLTEEALALCATYEWPGNIRELRNILERAVILSPDRTVRVRHLEIKPATSEWHHVISFEPGRNLHEVTREVARELVREALERGRTKQTAAELLGISRHALNHQIKILGLDA